MSESSSGTTALEVRHVSKSYGGAQALRDVSFRVRSGELHALVGGNGSGKSTMVKIMAGVEHSEPGGEIEVHGRVMQGDKTSAAQSRATGLHFVHQDPGLFLHMSIADNLALGRGYATGFSHRIRRPALTEHAGRMLERFEIEARPAQMMGELSAARRTMVAIARALQDTDVESTSEGVLILDEPTAALPEREAQQLLGRMRRFADSGQTVVYITHRLDEIIGIADRITVLRDGVHIDTLDAGGLTEGDLIGLITGRPVRDVYPQMPEVTEGEVMLSVSGLTAGPVRDLSFSLHRGEVLGLAGLLGSGRTTVLRTLFGDLRRTAGEVYLEGVPAVFATPSAAIASGIGYIPEDRSAESVFPDLSVRENLLAASIRDYWGQLHMASSRERSDAAGLIEEFAIKAHAQGMPISALSGGNQQKVVLARWLARHPRLLLLDEPTQGVDVGARADIYQMIREAVAQGMSVIIVASDPEELARVSDRVLILRRGSFVAEVEGPNIDATYLTELAFKGELKTR